MPSPFSILSASAVVAGCVLSQAAAIPVFKRATFDTSDGTVTVQNVAPPADWKAELYEPYE